MHDKDCVGAVSRAKGRLPFVPFSYVDQVVSAVKVHLGKAVGSSKSGMRGGGYRSFLVIRLRPQWSIARRRELCLFLMKRIGAPAEDCEDE